jgi:hypothetical protein
LRLAACGLRADQRRVLSVLISPARPHQPALPITPGPRVRRARSQTDAGERGRARGRAEPAERGGAELTRPAGQSDAGAGEGGGRRGRRTIGAVDAQRATAVAEFDSLARTALFVSALFVSAPQVSALSLSARCRGPLCPRHTRPSLNSAPIVLTESPFPCTRLARAVRGGRHQADATRDDLRCQRPPGRPVDGCRRSADCGADSGQWKRTLVPVCRLSLKSHYPPHPPSPPCCLYPVAL